MFFGPCKYHTFVLTLAKNSLLLVLANIPLIVYGSCCLGLVSQILYWD